MDDTWGPYRLPENGLAFGWRNFRTLKRLQVEYKTKIQVTRQWRRSRKDGRGEG